MPFQAVPNAALIRLEATLDGELCITNLGFGLITPATVTALMLQTLVDGVTDNIIDAWTNNLPVKYVLNQITGRVLDIEDGPQAEESANALNGALAGAILPNNCSLAVSFKTGLGGRTNRGRIFWPSFLESEVTDQRVLSGKQASILALMGGFIGNNTIATGWVWSVISRKELVPAGPGRAVPVTSVVLNDDVIDSMRRRLPGRGA
jgi:hypothetical protein